jgi:cytochrome c6
MMRMARSWAAFIPMALGASLAHAADTQNGAKLYGQYCVTCHGPSGKGATAGTPDFSRTNTLMRSDAVLFASIKTGKGAMPGFLGILRERDLFDVIAYLRTFN